MRARGHGDKADGGGQDPHHWHRRRGWLRRTGVGDLKGLMFLGLFADLQPRFAKQYADLGTAITNAVHEFCREVREGTFPSEEHEFR